MGGSCLPISTSHTSRWTKVEMLQMYGASPCGYQLTDSGGLHPPPCNWCFVSSSVKNSKPMCNDNDACSPMDPVPMLGAEAEGVAKLLNAEPMTWSWLLMWGKAFKTNYSDILSLFKKISVIRELVPAIVSINLPNCHDFIWFTNLSRGRISSTFSPAGLNVTPESWQCSR